MTCSVHLIRNTRLVSLGWAALLSCIFSILIAGAGGQTILGPTPVGEPVVVPVTVTLESSDTIGKIAVLTQGAPDLDFRDAGGGICAVGVAYEAKDVCTVSVLFKPQVAGTRYGGIVVTDSRPSQHEMARVYLQGSGEAPQVIFEQGTEYGLDIDYDYVVGVAPDSAGNFFVADAGTLLFMGTVPGSVYKESFSSGRLARTKVGSGFRVPWGVAVDGLGNVYISDAWNYRVYKEIPQPDGSYQQTVVGDSFKTPVGIAVDGAGNVYVADFGGTVYRGGIYKETLSKGGLYTNNNR